MERGKDSDEGADTEVWIDKWREAREKGKKVRIDGLEGLRLPDSYLRSVCLMRG